MKSTILMTLFATGTLPLMAEPRVSFAPHESAVILPAASPGALAPRRGPGVRIWTSSGEVVRRGERMRVYFRTERDAWVTIVRVDTDGYPRIIHPVSPFEDNFVRAGRTYNVFAQGRDAFVVDDDPGVGYVFAVASEEPFNFDPAITRDRWDLIRVTGGRIHGDPYQSLEDVAAQLLPSDYHDFDTHLLAYHVERRYDYPRFVCYDCHSYAPYRAWNPYGVHCSQFTLVVFRDPWYYYPSYWYPRRHYSSARVVFVQPGVVIRDSRFVFKSRDGAAPGIQHRDRRLDETAGRRPPERFVRGADLGGVGSVAVPTGRRTVDGPPAARPPARDPVVIGGGDPRRAAATRIEVPETRPGEPRRATQEPGTVVPGTTLPADLPYRHTPPERRGTDTYTPGDQRGDDGGTGDRRGVAERERAGRDASKPETPRGGAALPPPSRQGGASREPVSRGQGQPAQARPRQPESRGQAEGRGQAGGQRPAAQPERRAPSAGSGESRGQSGGERSRPAAGSGNSGGRAQSPSTGSGGLIRRRP
jgi:hypothetical protein